MKKLVLLFLMVFLFSCGKENKVIYEKGQILYSGITCLSPDVDYIEYNPPLDFYIDMPKNVSKSVTVEIDGINYTGTFLGTTKERDKTVYNYDISGDEINGCFDIIDDKVVLFFIIDDVYYDDIISEEKAVEIAKNYFSFKHGDISGYFYKVMPYVFDENEEGKTSGYYCVNFYKYIDGYKCEDIFSVRVNVGGKITGFNEILYGNFDNYSLPELDENPDELINNFFTKGFSNNFDSDDIPALEDRCIVILPEDNSYAIKYVYRIEVHEPYEGYDSYYYTFGTYYYCLGK